MSKKNISIEEYDKLIDKFAQELWLLRELWVGIKELRKQLRSHPTLRSDYGTFWEWAYRGLIHELYNGIFRFIDESNGVVSLMKLLKKEPKFKPEVANKELLADIIKEERDIIKIIENNQTAIKIKKYRHEILAHLNSQMVLDELYSAEFRLQNNLSENEIESLLNSFGEFLKKAARRGTFQPCTLPVTPFKSELRKMFSKLAQDSNDATAENTSNNTAMNAEV